MKKYIYYLFSIIPFFFLKITNIGIRISDTNVYFNVANRIIHGEIPYKDFFFANFPNFAYISSLYYVITGGNIDLFFLTSSIEVLVISFFIYKIVYEKTKNHLLSIVSLLLYAYSFIVLSTSDHQTGVYTASLFSVIAFYFLQRKKIFFSGIFVALSFFTKAYFIPIALSFFCYLLIKKQWENLRLFSFGFLLTTLLAIVPFLILIPNQFIYDIFGFSLMRPAGISKVDIFWFLISKDFILFIILTFNLINVRKNCFFFFVSLFFIIFFIGYQDIYYLYLNFATPFLCISFHEIINFINKQFKIHEYIIPTIVLLVSVINLFVYINGYRYLQKVNNIFEITSVIKNNKPDYIYGFNTLTPALSIITNTPSLSNINDAYVYFFKRGIYDKKNVTNQIISTRTIVITQGAYYPEYGIQKGILDNEILEEEKVYKNCKNIYSAPVTSEGNINRINLFKCY